MIPSFEELLAQAKNLTESNADVQSANQTNSLMAGGISNFVNTLLNTPTGEQNSYVGQVNPKGEYQNFQRPLQTGQTFGQQGINKLLGNTQPEVSPGFFPVTQKQLAEKALPQFLKMNAPPKTPLSAQSALKSGVSSLEEIKKLFPTETDPSRPSVSEVQFMRQKDLASFTNELPKPLSPEAARYANDSDTAEVAIDRMKKQLSERPDIFQYISFPTDSINDIAAIGDIDAQRFLRDKKLVTDFISRIQSGAVLNPQEIAFYKGLVSTPWSSPEIVPENLDVLKGFFSGFSNEIRRGFRKIPTGGSSVNVPTINTPTNTKTGTKTPSKVITGTTPSGNPYTIEGQ